MPITKSYLELLKYVQENRSVELQKATQKFKRNASTIRREIDSLNIYLADHEQLIIKNSRILCSLQYDQYLDFISRLHFSDYFPSFEERCAFIILTIFINGYANTSQIYEKLNLSLTTKKADVKKLRSYLSQRNLTLETIHRKGMRISGNEVTFRILVMKILIAFVEVSDSYMLMERKANTPIERFMINLFLEQYHPIEQDCQRLIQDFLKEYDNHLTYASKKFLVLYTAMSLIRKEEHCPSVLMELPLRPLNLYFFNDVYENRAFNHIIALLDFQIPLDFPEDEGLKQACHHFIDEIQNKLITKLHTRSFVEKEVYQYLYKSIISMYYDFSFPDKMVRNIRQQFPSLHQIIAASIHQLEETYQLRFDDSRIDTLTLIMKKWVNRNKVLGRNKKRIVIVTNTSFERIAYFINELNDSFEVELVGIYNLNEIQQLQQISYDWIFTFSDRIQTIINSYHLQSVKVNFFMDDQDMDVISNLGFSRKHHRLCSDSFLEQLDTIAVHERASWLQEVYEDIFI